MQLTVHLITCDWIDLVLIDHFVLGPSVDLRNFELSTLCSMAYLALGSCVLGEVLARHH